MVSIGSSFGASKNKPLLYLSSMFVLCLASFFFGLGLFILSCLISLVFLFISIGQSNLQNKDVVEK